LVVLFAELALGNIVRRVLHIIREEDVSLASDSILDSTLDSDDEDEFRNAAGRSALSAVSVAAATRNTLRAPSLYNLLESVPGTAATQVARVPSATESEARSRCKCPQQPIGILIATGTDCTEPVVQTNTRF
jgi:translation initiation factor eIF-2B subunit beta